MRTILAALLLAASAGLAVADDEAANVDMASWLSSSPQPVAQQAPAEAATAESSFIRYSDGCSPGARKADTARLLTN